MLYLIAGIVVYTLVSVYCVLHGRFIKTAFLRKKVLTYLSLIILMIFWLIVPFLFENILIFLVSLLLGFTLLFASQKVYTKFILDGANIDIRSVIITRPIKIIYAFVYAPALALYFFRMYDPFEMVLYSIISLCVVYSLGYLMKKTSVLSKDHRLANIPYYIIFMIPSVYFILSVIFSFGFNSLNCIVIDDTYRTRSTFTDYYSVNVSSIEDGTLGGDILDFYKNDDYVYYVVEESNIVTLKVYDLGQEKIVYEQAIDIPGNLTLSYYYSGNDFFRYEEETLYCFMFDGIYTFSDLELTKVSDLLVKNSYQFFLNDELYLFYRITDQPYEVYKISDSISKVDVITDTSVKMYVQSEKLISNDDYQVKIYGTDIMYDNPSGYNRLTGLTDTTALFNLNKNLNSHNLFEKETTVNQLGETNTISLGNVQQSAKRIEWKGEYFIGYSHRAYNNPKIYVLDDSFNKTDSYQFYYFNETDHNASYAKSKIIDDRYLYAEYNFDSNDEDPLYLEINELIKQDTSITIPFSNHISIVSYLMIGILLVFPIVVNEKKEKITIMEVTEIT